MIGFRILSRIQTVSSSLISNAFQVPNIKANGTMNADAQGFLPLEAEVFRSYFTKRVTDGLLSKEDIRVLTLCLQKMLVLDPNNRAQANVLLQDPWFMRSGYFEQDSTISLFLKSKKLCRPEVTTATPNSRMGLR